MRQYHWILKGVAFGLLLFCGTTRANVLAFTDITCTESSIRFFIKWVGGDEGSIVDVPFATLYVNKIRFEDYGSVIQSEDIEHEHAVSGPGPHLLKLRYLYNEQEMEIEKSVDCSQSADSAGAASAAGVGAGNIYSGSSAPIASQGGAGAGVVLYSDIEASCENGKISFSAFPEREAFAYPDPSHPHTIRAIEDVTGTQKEGQLQRNLLNARVYGDIEDLIGGRTYRLIIDAYYMESNLNQLFYVPFTYDVPETVYCDPYDRSAPGTEPNESAPAGEPNQPVASSEPEIKEYQVKVFNSCPAHRIYFNATITLDSGLSYDIGQENIRVSHWGETAVTILQTSSGMFRFPSTTMPTFWLGSIYVVGNSCSSRHTFNSIENNFEIHIWQ